MARGKGKRKEGSKELWWDVMKKEEENERKEKWKRKENGR